MFCFTETHLKDKPAITINELSDNWSNVLKETEHRLAFCYKNETVVFIEEYETLGKIEMMASLIESKGCKVIVIIVYRPGNKSAREFMEFNKLDMVQKVEYTTHIHGGILDLVFDINGSTGSTDWMPTPFSNHFVIYYDV